MAGLNETRSDPDDAQLIARSLEDGRSFEAIFDRHYRSIHRFISVRAGTHVADDLASETFTTAFRRRASYDLTRPDAAPWLYGIAVKLLLRHRQAQGTERLLHARLALGDPTREAAMCEGDVAPRLSAALGALGERDRDLIVLFAWAELTYEQLAEAFELPLGTVRSRLSRIRARLRVRLTELDEDVVGQKEAR